MANTEKRTLEIVAKVRDQVTSVWRRIGTSMVAVAKLIGAGIGRVFSTLLSLRSLLTGFVAFLAVRRTFSFITELASGLEEVLETADKVGATTESLQELRYAAELSGASWEELTTALRQYSRNIVNARRGSKEQADAFRSLGIEIDRLPMKDGKLDATAALEQFAERLQTIEDPVRRTSIMLTVFGKSGAQLGPLLAGGAAGIRAQVDELHRFTEVFDEDALRRAGRFDDALTRMQIALRGIAQSAFLTVADRFSAAFEALGQVIGQNREDVRDLVLWLGGKLVSAILLVGQAIVGLVRLLAELTDWLASLQNIPLLGDVGSFFTPFRSGAEGAKARIEELRVELDRLQSTAEDGNALATQRIAALHDELAAQELIAQAYELTGTSVDGLSEKIARLIEQFGKAFEAQLAAPPAAAKALGAGGDTSAPPVEDFDRLLRESSTRQQQLGAMRATLAVQDQTRGVRLALTEVDRELANLNLADQMLPQIAEGTITWQELASAIDATNAAFDRTAARVEGNSFIVGLQDGIRQTMEQWTDFTATVSDSVSSVLDTAFAGLSGAMTDIVTGTKSAKEAFKDLGLSILKTIADVIPRLLLVRALGGLFPGLADGGVTPGVTSTIPLRRFADGGVARSPTLAVFGEAGEEAFVPLKSGRIPVEIRQQQAPFVWAPTINALDAPSVQRLLFEQRDTIAAIVVREHAHRVKMQDAFARRGA